MLKRNQSIAVTAQAMPILPPHPLNPPLPNAALRLVEGENDPKPTLFAPLPGLKARLGEGLGLGLSSYAVLK